jgi:hypothetical protein
VAKTLAIVMADAAGAQLLSAAAAATASFKLSNASETNQVCQIEGHRTAHMDMVDVSGLQIAFRCVGD